MDASYFTALAEPTRFRIVELLRTHPRSVNEITGELGISQPQASKHLQYLAKAGIVTAHPVAQQRIYSLEAEPFIQLSDWARSFERYWNNKLNNLDVYLSKVKKGS